MATPLRLLLLEDNPFDAELVFNELRRGGYEPIGDRVETEQDYRDHLQPALEIILADFLMPEFDALRALEIMQQSQLDIPFIIVSGTIGEDRAVQVLQRGASDYIIKDRLGRLGQAVAQALERKLLRNVTRFAEASLRQSNQTLQSLIQAAPLAIVSLEQSGLVRTWNAAAEHIFGWSEAEVLGHVLPLIEEEKRKVFQIRILNEVTGDKELGRELRLHHKNGSLLDINLWTAPVIDARGSIVGTMGLFVDVTERKCLEGQLRQSQKMEAVGQLAAGVAHDFNNLLTVILGFSQILLFKLPPGDRDREPLEQIRKAGERAAGLTRQLLAFGRRQILAPVVLDLNSLVTEIQKMLKHLIGADIELIAILQPGLGPVKADPGQVEQIVMNLVVNARDAMPTGGRFTIQTRNTALTELQTRHHAEVQPGTYTLLEVSDTGSGMDEPTKARIFEPFFTTKEVGKGTGLGLATVFGIVKQSGGFIEVDSTVGSGTTFRIYLPQVGEITRFKEANRGLVKMPTGVETILLVEDDDGLRDLAQLILEATGYKVLCMRNGAEALQACRDYADAIELLFTDVVMPKMSGRQLSDLLVLSRPSMKVLYMSAYMDDTMARYGIQDAGANFLAKPFTPMILAQKVREVLDGANGHEILPVDGEPLERMSP
jgi:PAS domain S-box-containing protein